jgi:hypothetical protein
MKTAFPVDKFDLKGFIQNTLEYCEQNVSEGIEPSSAIAWCLKPQATIWAPKSRHRLL